MNDKIGIVLIHGAGLGSFIWDDLKPLIKTPVLTIEFPNREVGDKSNSNLTFDDYKKSATEQIEKWGIDNFVIVTHSIGGCVGLSLTDYFAEKVVGFVGISSAIPTNGKSFISCLPFPQSLIMPLILNLFGTKPPQKAIEQTLCNDLTSEQTSEIVKRFTPEAKLLYTTKVNYKNFEIKKLYIKLTNDKEFPLKLQDKMIKNLTTRKVVTIDSGHLPMISNPKELSLILSDFIKDVVQDEKTTTR
ncbi:MAG: alpha/beta hydrolase [Flavobacteriaceae bacterium]|jgi:pimeloyl-ACP methyl ester carboxylesterase|nr:alpha/beta hydrolase [Flavobacteriaceae bacterium]